MNRNGQRNRTQSLSGRNWRLTVFFLGKNQITPFPKQSATGSTGRRGEKDVLDIMGTLDGPLEVLQVAVGDLAHNCARRGLYRKYEQGLYMER